jgi:hypothetical protein
MADKIITNQFGDQVRLQSIELGGSGFQALQRLNQYRDPKSASFQASAPSWERREVRHDEKAPLVRIEPSGRRLDWNKWGVSKRDGDRKHVQDGQHGRRGLVPASGFVIRTTPDPKVDWEYDDYRINRIDGDWFWMAASWDWDVEPTAGDVEFAVMTVAAGPDLKNYFTREPMTVPAMYWERCGNMSSDFQFPAPSGTWKVQRVWSTTRGRAA